jgi:hypothetical protein
MLVIVKKEDFLAVYLISRRRPTAVRLVLIFGVRSLVRVSLLIS